MNIEERFPPIPAKPGTSGLAGMYAGYLVVSYRKVKGMGKHIHQTYGYLKRRFIPFKTNHIVYVPSSDLYPYKPCRRRGTMGLKVRKDHQFQISCDRPNLQHDSDPTFDGWVEYFGEKFKLRTKEQIPNAESHEWVDMIIFYQPYTPEEARLQRFRRAGFRQYGRYKFKPSEETLEKVDSWHEYEGLPVQVIDVITPDQLKVRVMETEYFIVHPSEVGEYIEDGKPANIQLANLFFHEFPGATIEDYRVWLYDNVPMPGYTYQEKHYPHQYHKMAIRTRTALKQLLTEDNWFKTCRRKQPSTKRLPKFLGILKRVWDKDVGFRYYPASHLKVRGML